MTRLLWIPYLNATVLVALDLFFRPDLLLLVLVTFAPPKSLALILLSTSNLMSPVFIKLAPVLTLLSIFNPTPLVSITLVPLRMLAPALHPTDLMLLIPNSLCYAQKLNDSQGRSGG